MLGMGSLWIILVVRWSYVLPNMLLVVERSALLYGKNSLIISGNHWLPILYDKILLYISSPLLWLLEGGGGWTMFVHILFISIYDMTFCLKTSLSFFDSSNLAANSTQYYCSRHVLRVHDFGPSNPIFLALK